MKLVGAASRAVPGCCPRVLFEWDGVGDGNVLEFYSICELERRRVHSWWFCKRGRASFSRNSRVGF